MAVSKHEAGYEDDCHRADVLITRTPMTAPCSHPRVVIDGRSLYRSGAVALYFDQPSGSSGTAAPRIKVVTSEATRGDDPGHGTEIGRGAGDEAIPPRRHHDQKDSPTMHPEEVRPRRPQPRATRHRLIRLRRTHPTPTPQIPMRRIHDAGLKSRSVLADEAHETALDVHLIGPEDARLELGVGCFERHRRALLAKPLQRRLFALDERDDDIAVVGRITARMMTVSPSWIPASIIESPLTSSAKCSRWSACPEGK